MRARRDQLILGAAAAALLIAIVVFAASTGVKTTPAPTPTPTPDHPLFSGSLEPGVRYRTRAFLPPLSFAVGDTEWLALEADRPDRIVLERRIRTDKPGSELPSRSSLVFVHAFSSVRRRLQYRGLHPSPYEPIAIGPNTGERFDVAFPSGSRLRVIVLPGGLAIELRGDTQRDFDKLDAPAGAVLRTLRYGSAIGP